MLRIYNNGKGSDYYVELVRANFRPHFQLEEFVLAFLTKYFSSACYQTSDLCINILDMYELLMYTETFI